MEYSNDILDAKFLSVGVTRRLEPSESRKLRKKLMQVLSDAEIDMVHGGDSWAGTPEGRGEPEPRNFPECMAHSKTVEMSQGRAEIAGVICGYKSFREWVRQL